MLVCCRYAALGALERQCAHIQFQEHRFKLWIFDMLVTLTLFYRIETSGLTLHKVNNWRKKKERKIY